MRHRVPVPPFDARLRRCNAFRERACVARTSTTRSLCISVVAAFFLLAACVGPSEPGDAAIDRANGGPQAMVVQSTEYTMVDISTPQDANSHAKGINNDGVIGGYSTLTNGSSVAFIRRPDGKRFDFGKNATAVALAINDRNQAAGFHHPNNGVAHATIFSATDRIQDLGIGRLSSVAYAINASGFVAGEGRFEPTAPTRAFLWSPLSRRMRDLKTPGRFSRAYDINDQGVVVGQDDFAFAFRWTATGGVDLLPGLGGNSAAYAINNRGSIVGYSLNPASGQTHAVLWPAGGGIIDLGTLGGWNSWAADINDEGRIVGSSELSPLGPFHAFVLLYPGPMIDLSGGPGNANAVNRCGQIAGSSSVAGPDHATLWDKRC